ncbi:hypothetical protein BDZ45DRAFT_736346 [Acephala macrosclerotiorum]|nr:hypothetical protein BDZ45DRAFT_736346 [Acephala macrosclerotiorum]
MSGYLGIWAPEKRTAAAAGAITSTRLAAHAQLQGGTAGPNPFTFSIAIADRPRSSISRTVQALCHQSVVEKTKTSSGWCDRIKPMREFLPNLWTPVGACTITVPRSDKTRAKMRKGTSLLLWECIWSLLNLRY